MPNLRVKIVRFVEAYQPGIVECQFHDADGRVHSIIGKIDYLKKVVRDEEGFLANDSGGSQPKLDDLSYPADLFQGDE